MNDQRKESTSAIDTLMDIALYSEGAVTYNQLKNMSGIELMHIQERLGEYWKQKAKSAGAKEML